MYEIRLRSSAERELRRLPREIVRRMVAAIDKLAEEPRPRGAQKMASIEHTYRIRLGQYRVIYEVDDETRKIVVTRIRHRKDAYR